VKIQPTTDENQNYGFVQEQKGGRVKLVIHQHIYIMSVKRLTCPAGVHKTV
jgi:hypothetical protein